MKGGRRGESKQLLDDLEENKVLEIKGGSTRSHYVEKSIWKMVCACRTADNIMTVKLMMVM